jgi:hypothetical protein
MSRPLMAVVAEQQKQIERLQRQAAVRDLQFSYLANLAGVGEQVEAIRKKADINNPGDPVPDPPSQAPAETTQEAATPEARDDVRNPGMTPGSVQHLPADTTDVAMRPGETLGTSPFSANQQDVTAPVAGTETHVPMDQTRIETDVRVGDPMNQQIAYPWQISPNQSNGGRTMAAIRLARLQIEAGLAAGDDLTVAAGIEASQVSDAEIASTIATLEGVRTASRKLAAARPVTTQVRRTMPSLQSDPTGFTSTASASNVDDDTRDSDLFL